jgi:tetratricopeptide (TPR) repeat protein
MRSVAVAFLLTAGLRAEVQVRQSTLVISTYAEGPPDRNPPFELFNAGEHRNYPYTIRRSFTNAKEKRTWRTLEIENEYLKCIVLPDLGGRIYSCVDKIANREMFYANTALKKADIGPRGAWVAAGTEFNFPTGHSWVNVSPVDFATARNADGGASIFVANTDHVQGTRWQVEITLHPASAALEEKVTLSNSSAVRRRYYWWNNAAVEAHDDTRFYYPTYLVATHGEAEIDSWPVNAKGVDMSRLENHTSGGVARFVYECREPFMAIYSRQAGGGVIHYADAAEVPGKKLWSWGAGDAGRNASKLLADDGTIYVEMQAGLFQDQETWGFLEAGESRRFTEYWMPARGLGGISRANLDAAVYLERVGAELKIGLNVTRVLANARIRVLEGEKVVHEERVSLDPRKTFESSVAGAHTFELYAAGKRLMRHTEGLYDAAKPSETTLGVRKQEPRKKDRTEREFLETAVDHESNGRLLEAARAYDEALGVFPESAPLNMGAGRTAVALKRYERAVSYLVKGARRDDIEPHYYLGVAYARMGDDAKARWQFERAREDRGVGLGASLELAQLLSRKGDRAGALRIARWAIENLPESTEMGALEAALLRGSGKEDLARKGIERRLKLDPANSLLRYERVRDGASDETLWRHLGADPNRVIEAASFYMAAGLWADALDILSRQFPAAGPQETEPGAVAPRDHPLVSYYRGYARQKLGQPGREDFAKAARQSTQYVFPDRAESFAVLEAALKENASDAAAHYLLGSLYLSSGMPEPAVREWQRAYDLHADVPGLAANLLEAK